MPARLSTCLLVLIVPFLTACDQASSYDDGSEPGRSSQTLSEGGGNNGQVGVEIRINHNPVIGAMNADWLGQNRLLLSAQVTDQDADPVAFAWSMNCAGNFDDPQAANSTFACDLPVPPTCTIHLDVNDGQGGTHAGDLILSLSAVVLEIESE